MAKRQSKNKAVAIFEGNQIRRHWDEEKELWYFSVIDIVGILSGSTIPKRYWSDLKIKLKSEGSEVYEKIVQLKFMASDGKYYISDATDVEISKKREPKTFPENRQVAREGGSIAGNARKQIEVKTGKKVITNQNAKQVGNRSNSEIKKLGVKS